MTARRVLCTAPLVPHREPIPADHALSLAEAAAGAGFDGVVLWADHVRWAEEDGMSADSFLDRHAELGLTVPAVEVLLDWVGLGGDALRDAAAPVLGVARRAGATSVVAATLSVDASVWQLARGLRELAAVAGDDGLNVSIEFLPWTAIPDLGTARRVIESADSDNLGVVIDFWHWHYQLGGPSSGLAELQRIDPGRVHLLQPNDAPAVLDGDWRAAGRTGRLLPGQGVVDIDALVQALVGAGADPLVAPEVMSQELAALGPTEMARRIFEATDNVLRGRLGWGRG